MFKPLALFVGLRYLRAKRRNHFVSFISLISLLGITLGVLALIVILSVMNGFEAEIRGRILGMTSHASIAATDGELEDWRTVREQSLIHPRVLGAAPYVTGEALLSSGTSLIGVQVRGIDPNLETQVSDVGQRMQQGNLSELTAGGKGVFLGRVLSLILNVEAGDRVRLITVRSQPDGSGITFPLDEFTVLGAFYAGQPEYDTSLAIVHASDAAQVFGLENGVSGVRLKLDEMFAAPGIMKEMAADLPDTLATSDWTKEHTTYFRAVKTEKIVISMVLFLIVAVAAFNIVATLVMVVTDKQSDIAVLRTLGLRPKTIMGAFMIQGLVIGVLGTGLGLICGVLLALNTETVFPFLEQTFGFKLFPADVFYISDLPSDLQWLDVTVVGTVAFILAVLSTVYPAWRASKIHPAEALRYE